MGVGIGSTRRQRWGARAVALALTGAVVVALPATTGASPGQVVTPLGAGTTPTDLVDTLLGGGITVANVSYSGDDAAAGSFTGLDAVGFGSGIVLSTGEATSVVGPNESEDQTTGFGAPGDAELDAIVAPLATEDAAVLEFDFTPTTSDVSFRYVFSSEEYNEYVNSEFNDVFAFFVNGQNCATVPGTSDPVSVNTVNGGNPFGTAATNPDLYRNNSIDDPGPPGIDTEMDGLTTVFTCSATVNANEVNTMKLAIADTSDDVLDTAVFLEALSFQSDVAPVCPSQDLSVQTGVALPVTLAATDANAGDTLTYELGPAPAHGVVTGTPPSLTYQSTAGYTGPDSFTYTATDSTGLTCTAGTVTITVTPPPTTTTTAPPRPTAVAATPAFTG